MFQMITASLRAVADIADTLPFLCDILAKKLDSAVSFKLPIALAAFRSAILSRLLPFGIFLRCLQESLFKAIYIHCGVLTSLYDMHCRVRGLANSFYFLCVGLYG